MAMGAIAVGAAVAWHAAGVARERRRQLRRGEIRELGSLWSSSGGCHIFARASTGAAEPGTTPVMLVHGFGISSSYFVPTAERLATGFAVYAPDLPGHGKSDTPREPMGVTRLADALVAWMDSVGLGRACLVGHSMGCQVAVDAAIRHPGRVDRLVLIGLTVDPAGRTAAELLRRYVAASPGDRPSLGWLLAIDYARMGPRLHPEFWSMLGDPIEEKLPRVAVPVLLVRGEQDPIAPRRWLDEALRLLGDARIVEIRGWGHAVHYSAARRLVEAITPFLREARRRTPLRSRRSGPDKGNEAGGGPPRAWQKSRREVQKSIRSGDIE